MDPKESSSSSGRKMKFTPKPPRKRNPKPPPNPKPYEADDDEQRRWSDLGRRDPNVERNSSVQVAFGPAATSSSSNIGTYGVSKGSSGKRNGSASKDFASEENSLEHSIASVEDQIDICMIDAADDTNKASVPKIKKEYQEPWDYLHSYYPTTLPLRKPYSGDPEIRDEEEFGDATINVMYDESTINPAAELTLLEKSEQPRMHLFKLPPHLPFVKQVANKKGEEKVGSSGESTKGGPWEDLPGGFMGKMLVYKSGAVKFKLGETLFGVSPGPNSKLTQDVVAMNTAQKHCCVIGQISKMAVVTPDLDSFETLEDSS
ncbi:putative DNA-directed RNA polymerase III subunit RPC4 [Lupinus albus]|uniref:Putative DNA-directed RNA polymerase III subunit RPC4 n=1 Tax=Lupinus albus TaxID=3870 RepID=A0A6A4QZE6_LUPAL|nr:putative DNA-directed RNA polymerase III subunit RPC4 [Lupinus albus]